MNIHNVFPSKYLKAADLHGRRVSVAIREFMVEKIGRDERGVVYFEGKNKGLVLNKTNANMILEIAGSAETDQWYGIEIVLYPTNAEFQGRRVDAIRVDYPQGARPKKESGPRPMTEDGRPARDPEDAPF